MTLYAVDYLAAAVTTGLKMSASRNAAETTAAAGIAGVWLHAHSMLRSARQMINEQLRPMNLTSAEGNILLHLWTQGEELGQEQLVEQLDISKPGISRALSSLEAKGYVTRRQDPEDRRARRVSLTAEARAIGPALEQVYDEVYRRALAGIPAEELAFFMELFARIAENFARAQAGEPPP